jgi:hypothetical protein
MYVRPFLTENENENESIDDPSHEEEVVISNTDVSGLGERVTNFLRRMVEQGKLVAKPRGTMTPEKEAAYRSDVEKKAIAFARDAHYPGKRYLVRWGGTRKGSGAFYTRPGLSGPLIHRTLAPLAYAAPLNADGSENRDAILSEWTPRKPEEILALKVGDIACGSGTFPVGALRFLTQALYDSVHFHVRITQTTDNRTAVSFFVAAARAGWSRRLSRSLMSPPKSFSFSIACSQGSRKRMVWMSSNRPASCRWARAYFME